MIWMSSVVGLRCTSSFSRPISPRIRGEVSFAVSLIAAGDGVRFLAVDERPLQIQAVMERATILNWFKHHLERSPQTGCVHVVVFTQTEHTPRGSPF